MTNLAPLAASICDIGDGVVACRSFCDGVTLAPSKGLIPRALFLEEPRQNADPASVGAVALGLNPGSADDEEAQFYLKFANTYAGVREFFEKSRVTRHPYHVRTKRFLSSVGITGAVLWTELVKCQTAAGVTALPQDALRTCAHRHLVAEIQAVPPGWPIVALGRLPFQIACILFPSRTVIGVPHPTGSYGQFQHLFETPSALNPKPLKAVYLGTIREALEAAAPRAVWLGPRGCSAI